MHSSAACWCSRISYEEEDTCTLPISYEEEDTCTLHKIARAHG